MSFTCAHAVTGLRLPLVHKSLGSGVIFQSPEAIAADRLLGLYMGSIAGGKRARGKRRRPTRSGQAVVTVVQDGGAGSILLSLVGLVLVLLALLLLLLLLLPSLHHER